MLDTLKGISMTTGTSFPADVISPSEWKDLIEDLVPPQGQWSEELYLALTDHDNRLIEFTDGFLEVLPMPTDKHQCISRFMFLALWRYIDAKGGTAHYAPLRLRIRAGKFREPDILLLLSATDGAAGRTAIG